MWLVFFLSPSDVLVQGASPSCVPVVLHSSPGWFLGTLVSTRPNCVCFGGFSMDHNRELENVQYRPSSVVVSLVVSVDSFRTQALSWTVYPKLGRFSSLILSLGQLHCFGVVRGMAMINVS